MTQLEKARKGLITKEMKIAARAEKVAPQYIRQGLVDGTIVICRNVNHSGHQTSCYRKRPAYQSQCQHRHVQRSYGFESGAEKTENRR